MIQPAPVVFPPDDDNTLLDNDRIGDLLRYDLHSLLTSDQSGSSVFVSSPLTNRKWKD
jgi:hypothetical protein